MSAFDLTDAQQALAREVHAIAAPNSSSSPTAAPRAG